MFIKKCYCLPPIIDPYRTPAPETVIIPAVIGNVGISIRDELEKENKQLKEENARLKAALSEKLRGLL